ncbi:MAG: hypothetical protein IJI74_01410 [Firmicutes bacterium]|nr:hypothetical protein [Bacillota bacterium]
MDSEPRFRADDGMVLSPVGGFASQRLTLPPELCSGETSADGPVLCGFRIGPAASTPLTAPLVIQPTDRSLSDLARRGIFKLFGNLPPGTLPFANLPERSVSVETDVFATLGVQYLKDTTGRKLMLLDEIGGHEMTCQPFMNALLELLAGDIPCLGVLKLPSSTRRMDASLVERNAQLRQAILNDFDGEILYYERGDESVRKQVEAFVGKVIK